MFNRSLEVAQHLMKVRTLDHYENFISLHPRHATSSACCVLRATMYYLPTHFTSHNCQRKMVAQFIHNWVITTDYNYAAYPQLYSAPRRCSHNYTPALHCLEASELSSSLEETIAMRRRTSWACQGLDLL